MNYKGILERLLPFAANLSQVAVLYTKLFHGCAAFLRFGNFRARGIERHRMFERVNAGERAAQRMRTCVLKNVNSKIAARDGYAYGSGSGISNGPTVSGSMEELRLAVPAPPMPPAGSCPATAVMRLRHSGE